jgi:hypothetical protein
MILPGQRKREVAAGHCRFTLCLYKIIFRLAVWEQFSAHSG